MLYWASIFFVIAIIAAIFGFGITAAAAAGIGKVLFVLALIGCLVTIVMHIGRRA